MTFISNIKELKGFLKKAPAKNKSRIEKVIQLYEGKKTPNFKTALNMVLSRACPSIYNPAKTDVQYQKLTSKYSNAIPITGRLEREGGIARRIGMQRRPKEGQDRYSLNIQQAQRC